MKGGVSDGPILSVMMYPVEVLHWVYLEMYIFLILNMIDVAFNFEPSV